MRTDFRQLERMCPIALQEMDAIRLMNRVDTKYLTDISTLDKVLDMAADRGYLVFEIAGGRIHEYRSMYYDTPELQMYLDHHNQRLVRQKLRTRCYVTTDQTFMELKTKNNHGRTKKKRTEIAQQDYSSSSIESAEAVEWLDGKILYPTEGLTPSLETVFSRITLVNPQKTERSTVDIDLIFNNMRNNASSSLGNLSIIEVKQDGYSPSALRDILLECRVKPVRISKYCIGTALTDPVVRSGRFKEKLMIINKMNTEI